MRPTELCVLRRGNNILPKFCFLAHISASLGFGCWFSFFHSVHLNLMSAMFSQDWFEIIVSPVLLLSFAQHLVLLGLLAYLSPSNSPQIIHRALTWHTNTLTHTVILNSKIRQLKKIISGYVRNLFQSICLGEPLLSWTLASLIPCGFS